MRKKISFKPLLDGEECIESIIVQIHDTGEWAEAVIEYMDSEILLPEFQNSILYADSLKVGDRPTFFRVLGIQFFQLPCVVSEVTELPEELLTEESKVFLLEHRWGRDRRKKHITLYESSSKPLCEHKYIGCKYVHVQSSDSLKKAEDEGEEHKRHDVDIEDCIANPQTCKKCKKVLLSIINNKNKILNVY